MSIGFKRVQPGLVFLALLSTLGLSGCGVDVGVADGPLALPGRTIHGHVHGGVYPIQNATIRLMETQNNGYGGAAKQLLQTNSDSNGYFTFPDTGWSCDSTQFAYIAVTGGYTVVSSPNYNVAQIGVIGNCGQVLANKSEIDAVEVFVSELSTIAAAYTLRNFITVDSTHASTGQQILNISAPANNNAATGKCSPGCVAAGLAHGFQNAVNLVDSVSFNGVLPSGQANATPPTNGYGFVPQEEVNTLGNILQSCVDSGGGAATSPYTLGTSRCGDLFYWATPPGGTAPTNTLQAALNMAQYPANNVVNLFNLQPRATFFTPTMSQAPNDLALSVFYFTQDFGANSTNLVVPTGLALDANDDVYVLAASGAGNANTQTGVLGMASNGTVLFAGPVSATLLNASSIATDTSGNLWFTNDSIGLTGGIYKASSANGAISNGTLLPSASGIAVDSSNNVWVSLDSTSANSIQEFTSSSLTGGIVSPAKKSNVLGSKLPNLTMDGSSNLWSLNTSGSTTSAVVFANGYTANLSTQGLNAGAGNSAAPNAAGEVYIPLKNQIDDAKYSGSLTTNNLGTFTNTSVNAGAGYGVPNQSEVDGAGNVFFADTEASGQIFEFLPSSTGNMNQGSLYSLFPCYPLNGTCYSPAVANGRSMQIDSTGAMWYLADGQISINSTTYPIGVIIQTFGPGAPTWPQMSAQLPGAKPQ